MLKIDKTLIKIFSLLIIFGLVSWVWAAGIFPYQLETIDSPADGEAYTYDSATQKGEWVTTAGSGDITDVWDCASGNCNTMTIETGEKLDGGTATSDATGEGIILPRATDCSASTGEGEICWDTDGDVLCIGDGATCASITGGGAPTNATYITQTANGTLTNEQAIGSLSTGIMRVANTTGVITSLTNSVGIANNISDETGSGSLVFANSPTFITPALGVATATTIDTGQGANELYDMNQNVLTTSTITFNDITVSTPSNIYLLSHDSFADFVGNEHLDWTTSIGTIHTDNYIENATHTGDVTGSGALTIGNDKVLEAHLKAVNAAVDEDIATYEATTGDFEWHTPAELITAGDDISWTGATLNVADSWWNADADIAVDTISESKIAFSTACASGNHYYLSGNDLACEADANTTYTAGGTLLDLTSTTFSVNEGTLTDTKACTYEVASGLVCNSTFLTGNESITLSGDVSGSGATAITTTIGANKVLESHLKSVNAATDEFCLTYESTTGDFEWQVCSAGSGDITDVWECNTGNCSVIVGAAGDTLDAGSADSLELPNSATPTTNATGEIALDTTIIDHQPLMQYYDGGENMTVIAIDTAELPALDNEVVKYDAGTDKFVLEADAGAGGGGSTTFPLYPYSAKITGSYVIATIPNLDTATKGCDIDAGDGNWRCLFDDTTDEAAIFYGILPSTYSSAPVCNLIYSMATGTANQVEWECAIQCTTPGDAEDIGTETFAAGVTSIVTVPGTAGHTDTLVSITPTNDSCAAGDLIYFYISTDANDATNDDATGDRELVGAYGSFTQ